tara:strand:+ start:120 stop:389 length:270 start_codon:yes stop_codon:yes gene_type:complete
MNNPDQVAFGQKGSKFLSGSTQYDALAAGKCVVAITAITALVVDTTANTGTVAQSGFEVPNAVPEGVTIFGRFDKVKIGGSEKAMLYFG